MGNDAISPRFQAGLEAAAERFIRRFDRNDNGLIEPDESRSKRTYAAESGPATVAFSGETVFFHQQGTAKADVIDGGLFKADTSGDGALSASELVGDFLARHDADGNGTTTRSELQQADRDSRRAFRQHLKAQTHVRTVSDDTSFLGRLGG